VEVGETGVIHLATSLAPVRELYWEIKKKDAKGRIRRGEESLEELRKSPLKDLGKIKTIGAIGRRNLSPGGGETHGGR